jgi:transposase-like protein
MNIIERGRAFLQALRDLAGRSSWDWRRCPHCGDTLTCKWGSYVRQPWYLEGRRQVRVQRHRCEPCHRTYSESSALLIRGGWYAREVRRCAIDHWQHLGTSARRTAEVVRSWLGRQERWQHWRPFDIGPAEQERCHLSGSTVERWLDQAGQAAETSVPAQLAGAETAGQLATDGLWARLGGGLKRVVLGLTDPLTGLIWPPVVAAGEAAATHWAAVFERAAQAGLVLTDLRGLASDGAKGLESYLRQALPWVSHQRCVFHLWRGLAGEVAQATLQAAGGLEGKAAQAARRAARRTLVGLIRAVFDAGDEASAQGGTRRSGGTRAGGHTGAGSGRPAGRGAGALVWLQPGARARLARVDLARFPLALEPRAEPRDRAAAGAGGVALGDLPELRACSGTE